MTGLLFFAFVIVVAALPAAAFQTAPRITDKQIIQRLTKLEAGQKAIREEEALRFDAVNKRFDSVNKRFDSVNKRIDDLRAEMNDKFDSVNRRIDTIQWMFGIFISNRYNL